MIHLLLIDNIQYQSLLYGNVMSKRIRQESGHARAKRKKERELLEDAESSMKMDSFFKSKGT